MLDEFKLTINGFVNMEDGKFINYEEKMNSTETQFTEKILNLDEAF